MNLLFVYLFLTVLLWACNVKPSLNLRKYIGNEALLVNHMEALAGHQNQFILFDFIFLSECFFAHSTSFIFLLLAEWLHDLVFIFAVDLSTTADLLHLASIFFNFLHINIYLLDAHRWQVNSWLVQHRLRPNRLLDQLLRYGSAHRRLGLKLRLLILRLLNLRRCLIRDRLDWLRDWLQSLLFEIIVDGVKHFTVEHIYDSIERFSLAKIKLLIVVWDHSREQFWVMLLHTVALEVMVLELPLKMDDAPAEASEFMDALPLTHNRLPIGVVIIHLYLLYYNLQKLSLN